MRYGHHQPDAQKCAHVEDSRTGYQTRARGSTRFTSAWLSLSPARKTATGVTGSRISFTQKSAVRAWVFLASSRLPGRKGASQEQRRILVAKVARQSGTRRSDDCEAEGVGLERVGRLGVPNSKGVVVAANHTFPGTATRQALIGPIDLQDSEGSRPRRYL